MESKERKAAIAAYKERKVAAGIFVLSCRVTGQKWVGSAPDLATIWNRHQFTLRHGSHSNPSLQMAWQEHGPDVFIFEEMERLETEKLSFDRQRIFTERQAEWCATLGCEAL